MATDRWQQAKQLFEAALALNAEQREAVLGALDPSLREEIESLLALHHEAESFLEKSPLEDGTSSADRPDEESVTRVRTPESTAGKRPQHTDGDYVGEYRILREIGRGGMGVVYEAEQQHPRRSVALKVIRGERFADEYHVRLFQREAQALARLKHPGIAGIYEAGCTDDGQHFFAMELVSGEPLSDYLVKRPKGISWKRELRFRLELFVKICEAVNYAHQRGVIHRDLKPSNILVSEERESVSGSTGTAGPQIKILDFGLARITDPDAADITSMTAMGRIQGTLPYMSPEQAKGVPEGIDIRSDVYSLGVIVYEMVTGRKPYDVEPTAPLEALRIICQEMPKNPKQALRAAGRQLNSDLETILLKALEKDPAERYQSVVALSADIGNYLSDRPILAHPPSTIYQLRKTVSRHKVGFGFAASVFLLVVALAVAMTWQSALIARERDRAENEATKATAINEFLQATLGSADPFEGAGREVTVLEALGTAVEEIPQSFAEQPEIEAAVKHTIGMTYLRLNRYDEAEPLFRSSLEIRRQSMAAEHPDIAESLRSLSRLFLLTDRLDEAELMSRQAVEMHRRTLGNEHRELAASLYSLGEVLHAKDDFDGTRQILTDALEMHRATQGDEHMEVVDNLSLLGFVLMEAGDYDGADLLLREALEITRKIHGDEHPQVAEAINNLAALLYERGDYEAAEVLNRESLAINRKLLGDEHEAVSRSLNDLAADLWAQGKLETAEPLYREALAIQRKVLGDEHSELAKTISNLALVMRDGGNYREAEDLFREALDIKRQALGDEHISVAIGLSNLASALDPQQKSQAAEPLHREAIQIFQNVHGPEHWLVAQARSNYALGLSKLARHEEAETELLAANAVFRSALGAQHPRTLQTIRRLADLYEAWGKPDKAAEYRAMLPKEEPE